MDDKIQIVNFLLTRRCNLHCGYCRISRDYNRPDEYPSLESYIKNEISFENVINFLNKLKIHNPDAFVIFYGGEPLLREDLSKIIEYCNQSKINYTIITNNSDEVQPMLKKLFDNTSYISGLTSSVDPILFAKKGINSDIYKKSKQGFERLVKFKDKVNDVVAEITVTNETSAYLYRLVEELTRSGISSSITFVDIAKSPFYDFSNITDEKVLVDPTYGLEDILDAIHFDKSLDVHMREQIPLFSSILPSNLDCKIEENMNNITVDADGSIRLCLRIRGVFLPETVNVKNIFDDTGNINPRLKENVIKDKSAYCQLCNWTCMLHSQLASEGKVNELLHTDKRLLNT